MVVCPRIARLLTAALLIGLLPGCAKNNKYYPQPLRPLNKKKAEFQETKNCISLSAKKLTAEESIQMFGKVGKELFKKPVIYPIQLTIKNHREKALKFCNTNINLDLCEPMTIINRLKYNTNARMAGVTTAGIATAATAVGVLTTTAAFAPVAFIFPYIFQGLLIGYFMLGSAIFVVPATWYQLAKEDYKSAQENNDAIVGDIINKTKDDLITIQPGELANILIFVQQQNYTPEFAVTFLNDKAGKEETTFAVKLGS